MLLLGDFLLPPHYYEAIIDIREDLLFRREWRVFDATALATLSPFFFQFPLWYTFFPPYPWLLASGTPDTPRHDHVAGHTRCPCTR